MNRLGGFNLMKRYHTLITFLIVISLITVLGQNSSLVYNANQQILNSQDVVNESSLTEIDQQELVGQFKLTFYNPTPDQTDNTPNITANGSQVKPGITVAVDPRYWEMGTKFYIEGYGYVVAEDTGSMIKGPRTMDVCVESKDQALKNGVQYRNVWVVKEAA
jgi:3D (Asp-Asp-Asp) domain-containing protein